MSLQNYVNLKSEAISAEYGKMPPFLHEEEQHHLERLQREGKEIFQQLKERKAKMAHKRELLRGMYKALKEMCHKPDVELLLVRTEKWGVGRSRALIFFQLKSTFSFTSFPTPKCNSTSSVILSGGYCSTKGPKILPTRPMRNQISEWLKSPELYSTP